MSLISLCCVLVVFVVVVVVVVDQKRVWELSLSASRSWPQHWRQWRARQTWSERLRWTAKIATGEPRIGVQARLYVAPAWSRQTEGAPSMRFMIYVSGDAVSRPREDWLINRPGPFLLSSKWHEGSKSLIFLTQQLRTIICSAHADFSY